MKLARLIVLGTIISAPVAIAQVGPKTPAVAERTGPLDATFDKWRDEWGQRHLARRDDPAIVVLNFFRFEEFDTAESYRKLETGERIRFGFDNIAPCLYQAVSLERIALPLDNNGRRIVTRLTDTIDLNLINWKDIKIEREFEYKVVRFNDRMTSAYSIIIEDVIGPARSSDPVQSTETKKITENYLYFNSKADSDRLFKAVQILSKICPGKSSPF